MTREQFIRTYGKPEFGPQWLDSVDSVFWAASYKMTKDELIKMSISYMKIKEFDISSSSYSLAYRTLND